MFILIWVYTVKPLYSAQRSDKKHGADWSGICMEHTKTEAGNRDESRLRIEATPKDAMKLRKDRI